MATYTQRFRNFSREFVARGTDPEAMPVFEIVDGKEQPTKATFPGCLRFMPEAEAIGDLVVEN